MYWEGGGEGLGRKMATSGATGPGSATASASNPRKFSEKIALQKQRQAEETAAFEEVMMDIGSTRVRGRSGERERSRAVTELGAERRGGGGSLSEGGGTRQGAAGAAVWEVRVEGRGAGRRILPEEMKTAERLGVWERLVTK